MGLEPGGFYGWCCCWGLGPLPSGLPMDAPATIMLRNSPLKPCTVVPLPRVLRLDWRCTCGAAAPGASPASAAGELLLAGAALPCSRGAGPSAARPARAGAVGVVAAWPALGACSTVAWLLRLDRDGCLRRAMPGTLT